MSAKTLKDKVIIVTGGSGGIGSSIVEKLACYDASIVSVYHNNFPGDQYLENVNLFKADLTKPEDWDELFLFTKEMFGKFDAIINCAAQLEPGYFLSLTEFQIERMIKTNFVSAITGTHKALKIMTNQGFGHIINIGSIGGIVPMPYSAVYSATKFGLRGFTFSLAEELKGTEVRISLIAPGPVTTKMLDNEASKKETAIAFISKPIIPTLVANAVIKILYKPKVELIIPGQLSSLSKLLSFSPSVFSGLYKFLHKTGIKRKRDYFEHYCNSKLTKGEAR
jgi:short-subunit dehydrogenase